jgi:hypothetical protein
MFALVSLFASLLFHLVRLILSPSHVLVIQRHGGGFSRIQFQHEVLLVWIDPHSVTGLPVP